MTKAQGGTSVLIVEDDFVLAGILTTLFQKEGIRVHGASSGEAALTIMRDRGSSIDWLLTDIGLPGYVDGWTVADEYRMSHPFRPVIYASTSAKRAGRPVHGSIFVEKPFQPAEILRLCDMMRSETGDFLDARRDAERPPAS